MTSATERFKALFANTVERVCVLEAQLEEAQAEVERLKQEVSNGKQEIPESDRDYHLSNVEGTQT